MEDGHFEEHGGGGRIHVWRIRLRFLIFWTSLALRVFFKVALEMGHVVMWRKVRLISIWTMNIHLRWIKLVIL